MFGLVICPAFVFAQCLAGDCLSGQGEFKFKNGTYGGQFIENKPHGEGTFSTRKGYSYTGTWKAGLKSGKGVEIIKKRLVYDGVFANNLKNGTGKASFSDSKYMENIVYFGDWVDGLPCGEGEMTYTREVRRNREKVIEKNVLKGSFINGIYQGRITSPHIDELFWEPFNLDMLDFQQYKTISNKERKRQKHPASLEGGIVLSCECIGEILFFDGVAIIRKDQSFWSSQDIPTKTKSIVLNTMQREFDIIELHATKLENKLNKEKFPCSMNSLDMVWLEWELMNRACLQLRKEYLTETAWLPTKGRPKNEKLQMKWDRKITNKLKASQKTSTKITSKIRKRMGMVDPVCSVKDIDFEISPIYPELSVNKTEKAEIKKPKQRKSFTPTFPRRKQLE